MLGKTFLVDQTGFWVDGSTSVVNDLLLLKQEEQLQWAPFNGITDNIINRFM
jgi:hypothetical protein